jgi:hypothetical protein
MRQAHLQLIRVRGHRRSDQRHPQTIDIGVLRDGATDIGGRSPVASALS